MSKISACIIANNEEDGIEKCLKSINDVVDEIIVVHDGRCSCRMFRIFKEYNARYFIREKRKNFNSHRVYGYKKARFEWILQVDPDEFLSKELRNNLRKLTENKNAGAYEFLWPYWNGQKLLTHRWPYKRCLFRKSSMYFIGIGNYIPGTSQNTVKRDYILNHRPTYNNFSISSFRNKWIRKARYQAETYLMDFKNIEKFNINLKDWTRNIRLRNKYPLILLFPEFLLTMYREIKSGAYREGIGALKFVFMAASYKAMINYYIFKLQRRHIK